MARLAPQAADLEGQLLELKRRGGSEYARVVERLVPLLGGKP
jgi:hypothetical protein